MAQLNLKQIADKLNSEFTTQARRLIFWYDTEGEFVEDVDHLPLENAKVLHLEKDNQFQTKYFLECVDTTTNYLVYAPFARPPVRENHLEDTIHYSKEFFADRASLLTLDLGIDERYKPVIQHYIKFFGNKARTQAFYDLELDIFNRDTIEVAMMSVLCRNKIASFEEVLRSVLTQGGMEENTCLEEFQKYELLEPFWHYVQDTFGYADEKPTLEKLCMSLFVTYLSRSLGGELPGSWKSYVSFKSGSAIAFLDNLMNSLIYGERFDEISEQVYKSLDGKAQLSSLPTESYASCGLFDGIDRLLIRWVTGRLELEDIGAKLGAFTIPQLCAMRRHLHFGRQHSDEYFALEHAFALVALAPYESTLSLDELARKYTDTLYQIDQHYRYFCYYLDKANFDGSERMSSHGPEQEGGASIESVKALVENIYANEYLAKITTNWSSCLTAQRGALPLRKQVDFYRQSVGYAKDQLVVIISDAMRYEVGQTLLAKLQADEKCTATMKTMISTLPSITKYGMAALLPHRKLELNEEYDVLIDGMKTDTLEQRQAILQKYKPASRCVRFDDIKAMNATDLRAIFTRQDVVYIYHNQIDARGDKLSTENEVFRACEEAVEEIASLIHRLTNSANRSHFLITADHGFLYRADQLTQSDKIGAHTDQAYVLARRYMFSDGTAQEEGTGSVTLDLLMNNQDQRKVTFPLGADIFKAPGSGVNFVHGGCSLQEMLVPLIDVKTERGAKETHSAQIALVSLLSKITNLIISLDFVQSEPVSDVVKETTYRIYFVDAGGETISNEYLYTADKKDAESVKRIFRLRFSLKNKTYSKSQKYYLVAFDDKTDREVMRHEVMIDIAFADDFGF